MPTKKQHVGGKAFLTYFISLAPVLILRFSSNKIEMKPNDFKPTGNENRQYLNINEEEAFRLHI